MLDRPVVSPISIAGRVSLDPIWGAIRSWFAPHLAPLTAPPLAPREVARELLRQAAPLLRWLPTLADLRDGPVLGVGDERSVRFSQEFKGVPVVTSEVIVNLHADGRLHSLYNQYHYDIPPTLDPHDVPVDALAARAFVARLTNAYPERDIGPARLVILRADPLDRSAFRSRRRPNPRRARFLRAARAALTRGRADRDRRHHLAWAIEVHTRRPLNAWRLYVDVRSGRLLQVDDLLSYASGRGKVFDPNPIVASGDLSLSWKNTAAAILDSWRVAVKLDRLDPRDAQGRLHLDGAWVHMEEFVDPEHPEPTSRTGRFVFSAKNSDFLDVMVYYHVDRLQQYLQGPLELPGIADYSIMTDPQGENGVDQSHGNRLMLVFGEGHVPDASDAMIIAHEYGHALQDAVNPGSNSGNWDSGVAEGFADFLAAVWFDDTHVSKQTRGLMFSWNANATDGDAGRCYDLPAPASPDAWLPGPGYALAELWASATFELYRKLGGDSSDPETKRSARDLAIRLHVVANANIPAHHATVTQMAQQIEAADGNLSVWRYANNLHLKVIYDTFVRRKVPAYEPLGVDVYVNDERDGAYGAADGHDDTFDNVLWSDALRSSDEIWVRRAPYGLDDEPSPTQHEPPLLNQPAHLYVRVKNRGAKGSGPVTVRAFRSLPAGAQVWPVDWIEIAGPHSQPADVPPGAIGVVAGPFTWTPDHIGHTRVLVIVECAQDRAVTQELGGQDHVAFADLVPFDNNIAYRDLLVM